MSDDADSAAVALLVHDFVRDVLADVLVSRGGDCESVEDAAPPSPPPRDVFAGDLVCLAEQEASERRALAEQRAAELRRFAVARATYVTRRYDWQLAGERDVLVACDRELFDGLRRPYLPPHLQRAHSPPRRDLLLHPSEALDHRLRLLSTAVDAPIAAPVTAGHAYASAVAAANGMVATAGPSPVRPAGSAPPRSALAARAAAAVSGAALPKAPQQDNNALQEPQPPRLLQNGPALRGLLHEESLARAAIERASLAAYNEVACARRVAGQRLFDWLACGVVTVVSPADVVAGLTVATAMKPQPPPPAVLARTARAQAANATATTATGVIGLLAWKQRHLPPSMRVGVEPRMPLMAPKKPFVALGTGHYASSRPVSANAATTALRGAVPASVVERARSNGGVEARILNC